MLKIDEENFNWLIACAPHVHINFNSPFFIEYLDNLKNKDSNSPKYVGKIFLKMLKSFTPDYDQKHIRSIVEHLYNSSQKAIAGKICNIYGSRGYEFLRDIYEKINNKSIIPLKNAINYVHFKKYTLDEKGR